jgi:hypothetical protein
MISIAPQFVVPDVVQASEYYRDKMGFEILGYFLDPPVYSIVRRGGVEIHFGKGKQAAPNHLLRNEGLDAYVYVEDTDALAEEFLSREANIIEGPVDRIYGRREIIVRDCYGFCIAFGS